MRRVMWLRLRLCAIRNTKGLQLLGLSQARQRQHDGQQHFLQKLVPKGGVPLVGGDHARKGGRKTGDDFIGIE